MKPIHRRPQATADIDAAIDHYLSVGDIELAMGFTAALEAAFAQLSVHPGSGSPRLAHELSLPGLRSWPLRRFPYVLLYLESVEHVDLWRVLHAASDIPSWLSESER